MAVSFVFKLEKLEHWIIFFRLLKLTLCFICLLHIKYLVGNLNLVFIFMINNCHTLPFLSAVVTTYIIIYETYSIIKFAYVSYSYLKVYKLDQPLLDPKETVVTKLVEK